MSRGFIFIAFLFCLSGCFKADEPMHEYASERVEIMDSTFGPAQLYYSLADRKVVKSNSIYAWDLAFECSSKGFSIKLNGAKGMGAYNTGNRNFDLDYKKTYYPFIFDKTYDNLFETAIGDWGDFTFDNPQSFGYVYIINRGLFEQGRKIGMKKLILKSFKDSMYHILFADPDGQNQFSVKIPKKQESYYTYFTFEEGGKIVDIEPVKDSWDLLITPYVSQITHNKYIFKVDEDHAVYDGVLLNTHSRQMAADSLRSFEEINFRHLNAYTFSAQSHYIGHKFWFWDDIKQECITYEKPTYILKNSQQDYYKFRFVSFKRNSFGYLYMTFDLKNL